MEFKVCLKVEFFGGLERVGLIKDEGLGSW